MYLEYSKTAVLGRISTNWACCYKAVINPKSRYFPANTGD